MPTDIHALISRRRRQILVHSALYYRMNTNIIADHVFDEWSRELAELQRKYPKESAECCYADAFADFDGSSGFDLPIGNPEVVSLAHRLLRITENIRKGETVI